MLWLGGERIASKKNIYYIKRRREEKGEKNKGLWVVNGNELNGSVAKSAEDGLQRRHLLKEKYPVL